jgi:hypothetical protein
MKYIFLYLDPGAGSMLLQVILAGILGFLTFFKNIKMFIVSIFKKKVKDEESAE